MSLSIVTAFKVSKSFHKLSEELKWACESLTSSTIAYKQVWNFELEIATTTIETETLNFITRKD